MDAGEPTLEQLAAYAFGELSGMEAAQIESAMRSTPSLAKSADRIRQLIATLKSDDTVAPSRFTIERVVAMFVDDGARPARTAPNGSSPLDHVRKVVATLVFNSRSQPALAGFRGAVGNVQMAFETDAGTIDLQIRPGKNPRVWKVQGQISCEEVAGLIDAAAVEAHSGRHIDSVRVDEHGRFHLTLPAGLYELHLQVDDHVVVLPNLDVG